MSALSPSRLKEATAYRAVYLFLQGGLNTALFVGLAHVLPAGEFDSAAVAQGVLVIAQALGDFGLSQAAVTVLPARLAAHPGRANGLIAGAARISLLTATAAALVAFIAVPFVPEPVRVPVAVIAPAAVMAVLIAGADGLLRAVGEYRRPVFILAVSRAAAFVALPVGAITESAAWTCSALSLGTVIGSLPALVLVRRRARSSDKPESGSMLAAAVPLGMSQLLVVAGGRLDTLFVTNLSSVAMGASFESSWRLYQLGQYIVGALVTAMAPFIGHAFGEGRRAELVRLLRWGAVMVTAVGLAWAGLLLVTRSEVAAVLFGDRLGPTVAEAIVPLAIVTPISFAAFLATMTLAASDADRRFILFANAGGAAVNLVLVFGLAHDHGAQGGALAAASGVAVTSVVLVARYILLLRRPLTDRDREGVAVDIDGKE